MMLNFLLKNVTDKFDMYISNNKEEFLLYVQRLKSYNDYFDIELRVAWDLGRMLVGSETICRWYNEYQCNDTHITTLFMRALKIALKRNKIVIYEVG